MLQNGEFLGRPLYTVEPPFYSPKGGNPHSFIIIVINTKAFSPPCGRCREAAEGFNSLNRIPLGGDVREAIFRSHSEKYLLLFIIFTKKNGLFFALKSPSVQRNDTRRG